MQCGNPVLSVIMPVFNCERYVAQAIESVLRQTFSHFELLIADDGSSDRSKEIISRYAARDSRITISHNDVNVGKVHTANRLFQLCQGEFVTVHDADDQSHHDRFRKQIEFLKVHKDVMMCGTNFISFVSNGKIVSTSNLETDDGAIRELIRYRSQFHGPTIVFKRHIVSHVGGLYRYFTRAEDIDFTMRVTEKYKVSNLPGHYYYYRHHNTSLTNCVSGYNVERLAHRKLLYYLAEERRTNGGSDSLMQGDLFKVSELMHQFQKEYNDDPEIALRSGVFRLLEMYMYRNAVILAWTAVVRRQTVLNLKCFIYAVLEYLRGTYRLVRYRRGSIVDDYDGRIN